MTIDKAIVPVDGSEVALKAARLASHFAVKHGWEIILLHVVERPPMPSHAFPDNVVEQTLHQLHEYGERLLSDAQQVFRDAGMDAETRLVEGSAPEMILEEIASESCGIVVLGSTGLGRGKLQSLLFGSVAEQVIRKARVPILLVKEDTEIC